MDTLKINIVYDFKSKSYNPNKYVERIYQINKNVSITMMHKKTNNLKNKKGIAFENKPKPKQCNKIFFPF